MNATDVAVQAALSQLGVPYQWGGTTPGKGLDCSGLLQYAWKQAGFAMTRTTYTQVLQGIPISSSDRTQWAIGDSIFPDPGHVQMYLGNGEIVEEPRTGEVCTRRPEWATSIFAVRRYGEPGTGATVSAASEASAVGDIPVIGGTISGGEQILSDADSVFKAITNPQTYVRYGAIMAGIALLIVGLDKAMGGNLASQAKDAATIGVLA